MVPLGPDGSRHTTLGLLTRAKHFIKVGLGSKGKVMAVMYYAGSCVCVGWRGNETTIGFQWVAGKGVCSVWQG